MAVTTYRKLTGVKIPMMPKGVEHYLVIVAPVRGLVSEDSYDAERR